MYATFEKNPEYIIVSNIFITSRTKKNMATGIFIFIQLVVILYYLVENNH